MLQSKKHVYISLFIKLVGIYILLYGMYCHMEDIKINNYDVH